MADLVFLHAFTKTLPFFILGLLMCCRVLTILNQSAYRSALQRYENWNDLEYACCRYAKNIVPSTKKRDLDNRYGYSCRPTAASVLPRIGSVNLPTLFLTKTEDSRKAATSLEVMI
jgi:hypothetical protein